VSTNVLWDLSIDKVLAEIKQGRRLDGRKFEETRKVEINHEVSKNADGAARVKFGQTDVVVGTKLGVEAPYPDSPDKGTISVGMELLAIASPKFEAGPPRPDAIELSRVVDRGIRESKAIDFNELCITEGEKCWVVFIDGYAINDDGNLFDACALAGISAVLRTRMPKLEDGKMVKGEYAGQLKVHRKPVLTTIAKVGNDLLVDPQMYEEAAMSARLSISTTEDDYICAMQKGLGGSFTGAEVNRCVELAFKNAKSLRKML